MGPIGVLCIRRTLAHGRAQGLASGLGAATADAFYGLIAAGGLTVLAALLVEHADLLRAGGGLFLLLLGLRTLRARPADEAAAAHPVHGLWQAYTSTLVLTLTNPMTIIAFTGIMAGLGVGQVSHAPVMVLGVFTGSALWWLLLSGAVSLLRARLTPAGLLWVNRASGLVITLFALHILLQPGQ